MCNLVRRIRKSRKYTNKLIFWIYNILEFLERYLSKFFILISHYLFTDLFKNNEERKKNLFIYYLAVLNLNIEAKDKTTNFNKKKEKNVPI